MKVILLKDLKSLGKEGEIKEVKDGYALNYLIPKGYALKATEANIKMINEKKKMILEREKKLKEEAMKLKEQIESITINIPVKVGEGDKLYGSVTSQEISENLKKNNINIDKKDIEIAEPIKKLGRYEVTVNLSYGIKALLKVWVVKE
jgi:large subunit ribosomal protein L9